jgi:hypothetical protein
MPARDGTSCLSTANARGVGAFQHYSVGASIIASEYIEGGKKYRLAELSSIGVAIMSSCKRAVKNAVVPCWVASERFAIIPLVPIQG